MGKKQDNSICLLFLTYLANLERMRLIVGALVYSEEQILNHFQYANHLIFNFCNLLII